MLAAIKYVKSKNAYVKIDSNATLTTEEKANSIINSGIDLISISIDGATKETYEKIRIPAKFEVVIENLKKLVRIRNEKKSKTQIHIAFVCQLSNFHELPLIIKLADQLGVDQLNSPFVTEYDIKMNEKYSHINYSDKEAEKIIEETIKEPTSKVTDPNIALAFQLLMRTFKEQGVTLRVSGKQRRKFGSENCRYWTSAIVKL